MALPGESEPDPRQHAARLRAESEKLRADATRARSRAAQLVITAERLVGEATVLLLEGALDMASAPAVISEVAAHRATGEAVRVDLASVDFVDVHGLSALLEVTAADGSARGSVELARPSPAVMRIAELTATAGRLGLATA